MWHRLHVHIVWTTRDREATLDGQVTRFLASFLPAVCRQERAAPLALGAVQSHVHVLVRVHPTTSLPRLVQRLKGGSSVMANREGHAVRALRWAKGYSVTAVGPRAVETARRYVLNQALHHPDEAIGGWSGWSVADEILEASPATLAAAGRPAAEAAARPAAKAAVPDVALATVAEPRL